MAEQVNFYELDGYPVEERDLKGFRATRKLICDWDHRYLLREALLANPGDLYPYIPDFQARVQAISMQPWAEQGQSQASVSMAKYQKCALTVQYRVPRIDEPQPFPQKKDPVKHENPEMVLSETFEPYGEARRLDYSKFEWYDKTPLTPEEAPIRIVTRAKYIITRYNQLEVPEGLLDYVGTVNEFQVTPVLINGVVFDPLTLLFEMPSIAMSADDLGGTTLNLTYRFAYKEEGWRKFWRVDAEGHGAYDWIYRIGEDNHYEMPAEEDFNNLLPQDKWGR